MPYEFDILELSHTADDVPERPHRDGGWQPFTQELEEHSRAGWELVDIDVKVTSTRNKWDRPQKVRSLVSVWKRRLPDVPDETDEPRDVSGHPEGFGTGNGA